jgi:hypothetical protein
MTVAVKFGNNLALAQQMPLAGRTAGLAMFAAIRHATHTKSMWIRWTSRNN